MEFLANENFPFPSTELLHLRGYKVRSIFEKAKPHTVKVKFSKIERVAL